MSRIPADKTSPFSAWAMPEITEGQIISAEKLDNRGPRGELVDVDKDAVVYSNITAGQLEDISNRAYEEVRAQAQQQGYREGYDKGLEESTAKGYQEGFQHGFSEGGEQGQQLLARSSQLAERLANYLANQDDEIEQSLVNIATCIARSIIQRELSLDKQGIADIVREALSSLPAAAENIQVFLNPEDCELLQAQEQFSATVELTADPAISAGGCRITTNHSVVDYTLEEQFQQTINRLVEKPYQQLLQQRRLRDVAQDGN